MNYAVIFAGGSGSRMQSKYGTLPKQFIEINNKPIIIYTLEKFEQHDLIGGIIVVMKKEYVELMRELVNKYKLTKVLRVVEGGETGQLSIYKGLQALQNVAMPNDVVLIHDGVRPMITQDLITENIQKAKQGVCVVSCVKAIETILVQDVSLQMIDRSKAVYARAPQTMIYKNICNMHENSMKKKKYDYIDTCTMALENKFGIDLVECSTNNIKITTPIDVEMFKGLIHE